MSMFTDGSRTSRQGCMRTHSRLFTGVVATAAVILTLGLVGCGDDVSGNPVNNSGGGGIMFENEARGGELVLGENEAWVSCGSNSWYLLDLCEGWIFREDGSTVMVHQSKYSDGNWIGFREPSTWSTHENRMNLKNNRWTSGVDDYYHYSVIGDTLIIFETQRFINTGVSHISVGLSPDNIDEITDIGDIDYRLALATDRVWARCRPSVGFTAGGGTYDVTRCVGYMFMVSGELIDMVTPNLDEGKWSAYRHVSTWHTSMDKIVMRHSYNGIIDDVSTHPYSLSDDISTLILLVKLPGSVMSTGLLNVPSYTGPMTRTEVNIIEMYDDWPDHNCKVNGYCPPDQYASQHSSASGPDNFPPFGMSRLGQR